MATTVQGNASGRTKSGSLVSNIFHLLPLRAMAVVFLYVAGYWKINPMWVVIPWGFLKYRDQKRLEKTFRQEAAKAIALRDTRKLVLSNVDSLPSWVYFPDTERCEWLNKVVYHVWPSLQPFILDRLKMLEPTLNEAMSKYKKNPNFNFNNINLGSLTPRVSGVRVYGNNVNNRGRTIIDIHLYYTSDGVFYCSLMNNLSFGGDSFEMKGCLRTIISTSEDSFFPGVEIFFLHPPQVDFNLTGLLNIGDIPGISGILRNTINKVIVKKTVLPNKIVINYDERINLEKLMFPDPEGLLRVNVVEARALGRSARFSFTSSKNPNPNVTIIFGSKSFTSPVIKNTIDPKWNSSVDFIVDSFFDETLMISVDSGDTNLGTLSLSLKFVEAKMKFDSWIQLENVVTGMIHLRVSYHELDSDPEIMTSSDMPAVLEVLIDNAKNLAKTKNKIFAEISVGQATQSSRSVTTDNPVFREVFSFIVTNPKTDKLRVKLIDESSKKILGNTDFDVKTLLVANNMEVINKESKLNGGNETSKLSLSLRLRTMKSV